MNGMMEGLRVTGNAVQWFLDILAAFVATSSGHYSEVPLQSGCVDWFPIALSLHQESPYIDCPYKKKFLYLTSEHSATPAMQQWA